MGSGHGARIISACVFFAAAFGACGGGSNAPGPVSTTSAPLPSATAANAAGPPPATATTSPSAGPLPRVQLQRAFPALSFERMTGLYQAEDGRMFVTEQPGRIMVFEDRQDVPRADVFLDIRDRVDASGTEMGLLGLALAPDFATSGKFYVNYTAGRPMRTVIARFTAPDPRSGAANPGSEERLLEIGQPFVNHNGGQIVFGPDGMLYIGMGDGGSANDPMGNGQNLGVLLAKMLRIDVSGTSPGLAYRIPPDNPFAGRAGARGEVWAYGLRNPWRFSFDPATGDLWAADVGQNVREEIDIVRRGENYGWNLMEGFGCRGGVAGCRREGLTLPIIDYATGANCSVTGGYVYRGTAIPNLRGAYVYGDYCSGRIWALRYDGTKVTEQAELLGSNIMISSFAFDHAGELYALAHASPGGIFKLVAAP